MLRCWGQARWKEKQTLKKHVLVCDYLVHYFHSTFNFSLQLTAASTFQLRKNARLSVPVPPFNSSCSLLLDYWHCPHDRRSGVYETVERPSVCPPSHQWAAARRCGGFAAVGPAARRYRSTAARPALSSKHEQCPVVSWPRKLNRDSLCYEPFRSQPV